MKIALLGYGKEGKATEKYFKSHFKDVEIDIFENFYFFGLCLSRTDWITTNFVSQCD